MSRRRTLIGFWITVAVCSAAAGSAAAGCTSDHVTRVIADEEGGPPKEAGSPSPAGPTCPSDIPIDPSSLQWKSPTPTQEGKCKDDDITAMTDFLKANGTASNEDFENFVKNRSATCHDCIFGDVDGPTWPPAPVKNGKVVTFNVGACYALTTGNPTCGLSVQHAWDCGFEACAQCDSPASLDGCRAKARTGICLPYEDKARSECGAAGADNTCGTPFDSIRVQCVTAARPVQDAGSDAADASDASDASDAADASDGADADADAAGP